MKWLGIGKWFALALCLGAQVGGAEKLRVVTTFLPGYSIAANVAGEFATVENLVPGNVSLHKCMIHAGTGAMREC